MEEIKKPDTTFVKLENVAQTAENCEKIVEQYKTWVDTLDEDSLKENEEEIVNIINEYESKLKEKNYELGKNVEFDGKTYYKEKVFKFIQEIINKNEVDYSYTLGLYQLYKYWENPGESVSYPILDSTLRTLESTKKFKGVNEWEKILVINEYFKSNNAEMTMDYLEQIFYAHLHNAIIDKLQINTPVEQQPQQEGELQLI